MPQSVLLKILGKTYIKEILVVVVFLLICEKFLIMLNMISCWLNVNSMAYVVSQMKGLNPSSLTENNLFLIKPL